MAKSDRVKEELAWLKVFFAALVAIEIPLAAWLVQNFDESSLLLRTTAAVGLLFATAGIIVMLYAAHKRVVLLEAL